MDRNQQLTKLRDAVAEAAELIKGEWNRDENGMDRYKGAFGSILYAVPVLLRDIDACIDIEAENDGSADS